MVLSSLGEKIKIASFEAITRLFTFVLEPIKISALTHGEKMKVIIKKGRTLPNEEKLAFMVEF
jgi:hypothetical protein